MASSSTGISLLFLCVVVATAATGTTSATCIKEACSRTPHPDFCVGSLLSDPAASTAEPSGLPGIAVRLAANNAEDARVHASALLMEGAGSGVGGGPSRCLHNCEQKFADAAGQLEGCTAALDGKDYVSFGRLVEAAAADATCCRSGCESAVGGGSSASTASMAEKSEDLLKLCDVALALAKLAPK